VYHNIVLQAISSSVVSQWRPDEHLFLSVSVVGIICVWHAYCCLLCEFRTNVNVRGDWLFCRFACCLSYPRESISIYSCVKYFFPPEMSCSIEWLEAVYTRQYSRTRKVVVTVLFVEYYKLDQNNQTEVRTKYFHNTGNNSHGTHQVWKIWIRSYKTLNLIGKTEWGKCSRLKGKRNDFDILGE